MSALRRSPAAVAAALAMALVPPALGAAQPPAESGTVTIDAAQAIEWRRGERLVIARGDAKAVRGDLEVRAEVLKAHYREGADGAAEVYRLDADGNVRIASPSESGYAEKGTYDMDKDLLTLSGGQQVGIVAGASRVTAEDRIEYDSRQRKLVAYGDAVAVDGDRTLYGDVITVLLRERAQAESRVQRVEADGHARFVTPDEEVLGSRGTYDVDSGVATMTGAVKVIQGENVLNGCRGEINLKTGVSRLLACPQAGGERVQGVILPDRAKKP